MSSANATADGGLSWHGTGDLYGFVSIFRFLAAMDGECKAGILKCSGLEVMVMEDVIQAT